jgi:hypothetical protein
VTVAACTSADSSSEVSVETAATTGGDEYPDAITRELGRMAAAPRPVANSAMPPRHLDRAAFPEALVDRELIVSGGPPPDGIAPIDDPRIDDVADVDWLSPDEAVLVLLVGERARAYPVRVLIWHEIVNDELAGLPVAVTYCPLCSSGLAFERTIGDDVLDFGTSGSLYQANLVMYDRQTESLWTQFDGRSVIGDRIGDVLDPLPVATVTWSDFATLHPRGTVLSQDTGFDRPYGTNPYPSYEARAAPVPGFYRGDADGALPAYERIVGVEVEGDAIAVRRAELAETRVIETTAGALHITMWHADGLASPLSGSEVDEGERIGASEVYVARVDGAVTSFSANGDGTFTDDATRSTWSVLGEAVDGPRSGDQLEAVVHADTFWFAWATYFDDTRIVEAG